MENPIQDSLKLIPLHFDVFNLPTMYLKANLFAPVALAAVCGANIARDIEPCAQITNMVSSANQAQSMSSAWPRMDTANHHSEHFNFP